MAHDLNIPINLNKRWFDRLQPKRRAVDLARIGDTVFMLRAYTGLNARCREQRKKDKYGQLAYIQASMKFLTKMSPANYRATVDGELIEGRQ